VDYALGSDKWPGLSKLIEEFGEVIQVAGKIIATDGEALHFDGTNLVDRLTEELGDASAAIDFLVELNGLSSGKIEKRKMEKFRQFVVWHVEQRADNAD
jgi:NTP pyrophosphatase (non-canonical NTP hydrolase)